MKILATSDTHGNLEGIDLAGIDIALLAGDIAPLKGRGPWHVYDQVKWMRTKFSEWCKKWPTTEVVFIPGNHDFFPIAREHFKSTLAAKDLSLGLQPNAHMLIDEMVEVKGVKIYGTPWVPIISYSWAFEAESDRLREKFDKIPEGVDILLTHTPPRLDYVDVSLEYGVDSEKFGSHELADAIFKKRPKLAFCGHIHSGSHIPLKHGDTVIYNVARVNERYNIGYEPCVLDL